MNTYLLHKAICKYIKLSALMQGYDYFRIPRNTLCLPPKLVIVFKCSQENALLPGAFENNGSCKIWGQTECFKGNSKIENTPL